jgi:hypothetical protein
MILAFGEGDDSRREAKPNLTRAPRKQFCEADATIASPFLISLSGH